MHTLIRIFDFAIKKLLNLRSVSSKYTFIIQWKNFNMIIEWNLSSCVIHEDWLITHVIFLEFIVNLDQESLTWITQKRPI